MIRVAIADDHPLVREGIKKVLNNEIDIKIVAESSNGNEVLSKLEKNLPDILVLDLTMPGKSGLDLIKSIANLHPSLPMLVLSVHPVERFAIRTLKAGASGYLNKSSISDELVKGIRKITTEKRRYISDEVAEQLAQQIDHTSGRPLHETLSDREFEVLCMIAEGKNINTIASKLSLSPNTVHTYRSRIKDKMNLASNVEMTRYAIKNDLIT